ncbi:MAG TPA: histidine phosphatase family protein [Streptosporangiaceae bacterium]|nr:histidine phosphatase family protein [Streptosporangiaceae bacterium]
MATPLEQPKQVSSAGRGKADPWPSHEHTEILLIRHGETEQPAPGVSAVLTNGYADPALTPLGRQQAARLADRLATTPIDAFYVTPLRRTAQTAQPLVDRAGAEVAVADGLREVHLGEWEGSYRDMVARRHPLVAQVWAAQRWDVIPGAEPSETFAARVHAAVEQLAAAHPGERLAVFTHGGVIGQVLADATGSRPFAFVPPANASISRLVVAGQRWVVRSFNDTAHLEGPGAPPVTA